MTEQEIREKNAKDLKAAWKEFLKKAGGKEKMPAKTIKAVYAPQMRVVYVSHPFTGNEWNNRQDAREVCRRLHKQHPDWCIVNPIDTFWWAEFLDISYDDILKHCIILLLCCDAIYLCRGWQESTGCRAEYAAALENGTEVIYK